MINYFNEQIILSTQKQKNKLIVIYSIVAFIFMVITAFMIVWFVRLPYQSKTMKMVKAIEYTAIIIFTCFSFIFLGIKYRRAKKFYTLCEHLKKGLKETSVASFVENNDEVQIKDGVEFKSLIFLEWNKFKNDFYERKVLVFAELPFPAINPQSNVKFVTQGNVLIKYEILDEQEK